MELNEQIKLLKNKMTLLTEEQIFGEEQLEIFKKFGTKCVATDLSRLLGCAVTRRYCIDGDDPRKNRTGKWWSQSISKDYFYQYGDSTIFIVSESGESTDAFSNDIDCGVRPVLPYSLIKEFSIEKESVNGIKIIEYGEYPQMILPFDISYLLDREYEKLKTGKIYIFTMNDLLIECEEYQCNGKKYIRFVPNYDIETFGYGILSDGRKVKKDEVYWIEV